MKVHSDDRRTAFLEIFATAFKDGDLTATWIEPGAILGWHRHQHQDDHMLVLVGSLKIGTWVQGEPLVDNYPGKTLISDHTIHGFVGNQPIFDLQWTVLTDHAPRELVIPRGKWHGYQNIGHDRCLVLTWITQKYDPSDEERLSPASVPISWERIPR